MRNIFFYPSDIGKIGITARDNVITNLYFPNDQIPHDADVKETEILKEAGQQLYSYLAGKRKDFDLPLAPDGTAFRLRVWESLRGIPYGETRSYGQIAQSIGNKKAARAVGQANHHNPIPIFIPCHRVIGSSGKLVGYSSGLQIKTYLLALEKQYGNL